MPRQKNPENVYELTCAVTKNVVHTNPKQFQDLMDRYEITRDELMHSYISREGRNLLKAEGISKDDAISKYNIHPKVADCLKCFNQKRVINPRKKKVAEPVNAEPVEAEPVEAENEPGVFIATEEDSEAGMPVAAESGGNPY